jgi:hypothetical protein
MRSNDSIALILRAAVLYSQILSQVEFKHTVVLHSVALIIETKQDTVIDCDLSIIVGLRAVANGFDLASQSMGECPSMLTVSSKSF